MPLFGVDGLVLSMLPFSYGSSSYGSMVTSGFISGALSSARSATTRATSANEMDNGRGGNHHFKK
jgi:hypothetical protein